jgi:hypothetical protein
LEFLNPPRESPKPLLNLCLHCWLWRRASFQPDAALGVSQPLGVRQLTFPLSRLGANLGAPVVHARCSCAGAIVARGLALPVEVPAQARGHSRSARPGPECEGDHP